MILILNKFIFSHPSSSSPVCEINYGNLYHHKISSGHKKCERGDHKNLSNNKRATDERHWYFKFHIHKCCSFFADELHFGMSYVMMRASCRNWSKEWTWNTSRMVEWMELGTWKIEFVLCSLDRKKETLAKLENSPWNISSISNTPCDRYIFFLVFQCSFSGS